MGLDDKKIVVNGATSQYDRRLAALDAEYAKVDGRSSSELLDFAVKFGSLINFYNLRNEIDGDWTPFFTTDPVVILASRDATDLGEIESEFARLERLTLETQSFDRKLDFLRGVFDVILKITRELDLSLRFLDLSEQGQIMRQLRQAIVTEIEDGLGQQLRELKAYDLGAELPDALGRRIGLDYEGLSPVWQADSVGPNGSIYRGGTGSRKIAQALPHVNSILSSYLYALSNLKVLAQTNLSSTMEAGDHKPQIALYIAFVTLFQTAQDTINTLSSRYSRFYYRDVLRESFRAAIPDSVFLSFTLADQENFLSTTVPRDTLFLAGTDSDDHKILYGSDKDLLVTQALLTTLRTLRVIRGKLIPQEQSSPLVVSRVLSSEIVVAEASLMQNAWATFGETEVSQTDVEVTEAATLGFALASQYLWMSGGRRVCRISFRCSPESQARLIELLHSLAVATSLSEAKIFETVLVEAFTLYVSMSAGWFQIESYRATEMKLDSEGNFSFGLEFELPASVPPIVAYNPADEDAPDDGSAALVTADPIVYASDPAPSLPTLKTYLRQVSITLCGDGGTADVYPISLLGELEITTFLIDVSVCGLAGLQLESTDGELDPSGPFSLFGGLPVVGSYLLIRHDELFAKRLNHLGISINWFNLPPNEDGFTGYYKDYVIGLNGEPQCNLFNNAVFHGGMSIQNSGEWFLSDSQDCLSPPATAVDLLLFRSKPECYETQPAAPLCPVTDFNTLKVCRSTPPPYYDFSQSAIKLELTEPPYAFGNDLFPQNVLNAVLEDLPDTNFCKDQCLSECLVLLEAAQCIETCLLCIGTCAQASPPDPSCAETCVSVCLKCLEEKSIQCLEKCLEESRGLPIEETLRLIITRLKTCPGLPEPEQCVVGCNMRLAACLQEQMPECVRECIENSTKILDAIVCVLACVNNCQGKDTQCLIDGLLICKQQLDSEYATCLEKCMHECLSLKKTIRYPNEPYLPQATSITVTYCAQCVSPSLSTEEACGLFFHLGPFGGYEQLSPSHEKPSWLLPRFSEPGNLYLGFTSLVPPQTLTLLFQMSASGDDRSVNLPPVAWEYLSSNQWHRLKPPNILADQTNGLQNSGIITLDLPAYDPANNTLLSADTEWLRASVAEIPDQFPKTAGIYPHSVLATWRKNESSGENLAKPLPPFTITSSVEDLSAIASVIQPMASFGGRPPETNSTFEIRVGERLRHKERAILDWDYERLVLERFPTVWKAQTLPARDPQQADVPGSVVLVIVPGPDGIAVTDPTVPAACTEMLAQIQAYLKGFVSPFIQLHVVNPIYVRITVNTVVLFQGSSDTGASIKRLNEELVDYLSPWFYDAARAAQGGRYISEADISEFIRTRPYVELMISINLKHEPPRQYLDWYFLTSAQQHQISAA
ncbi:MAG TPA: baseplate J/gp47 family protein [Pyrinomonadaceae bacterium]|nr:baseplate J/gp47 family protein [Pyrinomonadaceae bacterium]